MRSFEHRTRITTELARIGTDLTLRGISEPANVDALTALLLTDLEPLMDFPDVIEDAIRRHRLETPFFPHISDLRKIIGPDRFDAIVELHEEKDG